MKKLNLQISCPSCSGTMVPKVISCAACEIDIKGEFETNEFANLSLEDLHFLRIFVFCEGRIRDMETALGISYPSIKSKVSHLKNRLKLTKRPNKTKKNYSPKQQSPKLCSNEATDRGLALSVLRKLQSGDIGFNEALAFFKNAPTKNEPTKLGENDAR